MNIRMNGLKIIKIAGGSLAAILIAQEMGLNYASSAGIITLLSIQDTKRETLRVLGKRAAAFAIALILAPVCFGLAGYHPAALGLFLLLFAPVCTLLRMQEGISVSTVLMTHFLSEGSLSFAAVGNETLLFVVGAGIGAVMNLYIPGKKAFIRSSQVQIEAHFRSLLAGMSVVLAGEKEAKECRSFFTMLERLLSEGEREAYQNMENSLLTDTRYYLRYMGMRRNQLSILQNIQSGLEWGDQFPRQAVLLSKLLHSISDSFHEYNNARSLLAELEEVKGRMREQPLPVTREEFENRAVLFQMLLEIEQFLVMKRDFVEKLGEKEIEMFWERA